MRVKPVTCIFAGAMAVVSLAACSSDSRPARPATPDRAMSAAELRTHLLPAVLPDGWTSHADPATPGAGSPANGVAPCAFISGMDVVDGGATAAAASATALFGARRAPGGSAGGLEELYSFAGDGAARAMAQIRRIARSCARSRTADPFGTVTREFSAADGPRLGDDSVLVRGTTAYSSHPGITLHDDAVVVRVGNTLVVIGTTPTSQAFVDATLAFAPAAVEQVASDHPGPVDAAP